MYLFLNVGMQQRGDVHHVYNRTHVLPSSLCDQHRRSTRDGDPGIKHEFTASVHVAACAFPSCMAAHEGLQPCPEFRFEQVLRVESGVLQIMTAITVEHPLRNVPVLRMLKYKH